MEKEIQPDQSDYSGYIRGKRIFVAGLAAAVAAVFIYSVARGASNVNVTRVLAALFGQGTAKENVIIRNLRLPRSTTALIAGFGLGMTGCVMQGILRNPLASASTIGVSQGAAFGAAFAIIVLGGGLMSSSTAGATLSVTSPVLTAACAFAGSMMSTVFILFLSRFRRFSAGTLILAGVALSSLFSAGTTLLQYFADDVRVAAVVYWTFGDLGSTFWKQIAVMGTAVLAAGIYFFFNCWNYNAMQSGEDTAKGLGINTDRIVLTGMVVGSLTASVIVSYVGIINFVGLIAPHLIRRFTGTDYRFLLPASGLAGAALLLLSDTAARMAVAPIVLPIGAITSALGAPLFLWIIFKGRYRD